MGIFLHHRTVVEWLELSPTTLLPAQILERSSRCPGRNKYHGKLVVVMDIVVVVNLVDVNDLDVVIVVVVVVVVIVDDHEHVFNSPLISTYLRFPLTDFAQILM